MKTQLVAFLLFFLCAISLKAQLKEFDISEMPRPDVSIVQANTSFPEDALIIVYSSLDDLSFRSSMGAIDKQNYNTVTGRYELLIKPIKQMLFVGKPGFLELKLNTLNPNVKDVYFFKVEEKKTTFLPPTSTGKLTINSNPSGANISLNGIPIAPKTPFTGNLNPGQTRIQLSKENHQLFDTTIVLQSNINEVLNVNLTSTSVWLNVNSTPAYANVYLDGKLIGTTPLNLELDLIDLNKHGNRLLKITLPGYSDQNQMIQLYPSKDPVKVVVNLKRLEGGFLIESKPIGANVYIDGAYYGQTPLQGTLPVGLYSVDLIKKECTPSSKKQLLINDKSPAKLNFELQLKSKVVYSSNKIKNKDFKNIIYSEIGGSDELLSFNYERCLWVHNYFTYNARFGIGISSMPIMGLNTRLDLGTNKIEFGINIIRQDDDILDIFSADGEFIVKPNFSYKRINQKGYFFGIAFCPYDGATSFLSIFGVSFGTSF